MTTHRPLGNSGISLPQVVFGSTCLGNLFVQMSDEEKQKLVEEWFRCMPKPVAIDSAGKYGAGLALEVIGRELARLGIAQQDVIISNKLAWRRTPLTESEPTFEPGVWIGLEHDAVQEVSYEGILRCHDDGCSMLGSYIPQLVSVHDPDEYLNAAIDAEDRKRRVSDIVEAYRALTELKDAGKVWAVGVGAKNWQCIRELAQHCQFDWVMMANSLTIMNHPQELLEFVDSLHSQGIGLINSAVTHGGFLTGGKFLDYHEIDPLNPSDAQALEYRERLASVCSANAVTPYEVCVAFGRSHPAVSSLALSTSRVSRVEELISVANRSIDQAVWDQLRSNHLIGDHYLNLGPH